MTNLAQNILLPGDSTKRKMRGGIFAWLEPGNIWTPNRERQLRDIRAARGAVEAARRRHGPRVPLCSTTFGGSTIPPLFGGGGGGFLQGDIRIATTGADYLGQSQPATVLPSAGATVGDELWQSVCASGTWANPAGWTVRLDFASHLFNRFRMYSRIADGTAGDDFIMPANTLMVIAKQWSLAEVLPFDTWPSSVVQGGQLNNTSNLAWDVGFNIPPFSTALTANATGDPSKFVLGYFACQDRQQPATTVPTIQDSNPSGMETIVSIGAFSPTGGASVDTILMLVPFQYLAVSVAYTGYEIGRTPGAPNTYIQATQYQRMRIF